MPKPLRADKRELRLAPIEVGTPTVDIFFDEHRVWSTKLPKPHPRTGVRRIPGLMRWFPICTGTPQSQSGNLQPGRKLPHRRCALEAPDAWQSLILGVGGWRSTSGTASVHRSTATHPASRTGCLLPRRRSLDSWVTGATRSTSWVERCSVQCGPAICCRTTTTSTSRFCVRSRIHKM